MFKQYLELRRGLTNILKTNYQEVDRSHEEVAEEIITYLEARSGRLDNTKHPFMPSPETYGC